MHLKVLQLKKPNDYRFMSYDYASTHGFNLNDYSVVYELEVDSDNSLDDFFRLFNVDIPEDFTGHSLSTSDILDLDGNKYYCDDIGWTDLQTGEKY